MKREDDGLAWNTPSIVFEMSLWIIQHRPGKDEYSPSFCQELVSQEMERLKWDGHIDLQVNLLFESRLCPTS